MGIQCKKRGLWESNVKIRTYLPRGYWGMNFFYFLDPKVQKYFEVMYEGHQNSSNTYFKNILRNFNTEIGKMQIMLFIVWF